MYTSGAEVAALNTQVYELVQEIFMKTEQIREALERQEIESLDALLTARGQCMTEVDSLNARLTILEQGMPESLTNEARQHSIELISKTMQIDRVIQEHLVKEVGSVREEMDGLKEQRKGASAYSTVLRQETGGLVNQKK